MTHDLRHEEELAVLLSESDARTRFEASALASCATCREEFASMTALTHELAQLRADETAELAASNADVRPGRAEAALGELARRETGTAAPPARRAWFPAMAAAAVLALVTWAIWGGPADEDPDGGLLGPTQELEHPLGQVTSFTPFRWSIPCPEGSWFVVRVEADGFELESPRLTTSSWTPDEDVDWPSEIDWSLSLYRGTGQGELITSYPGWAER